MILLNEKKECCGCGACAESCPARCIRMEEDAEGFLYPTVQADACTGIIDKTKCDVYKNEKRLMRC